MDRLDRYQSILLKIINKKGTVSYGDLDEKQKSACEFLKSKGFVSFSTSLKTESSSGFSQSWQEIESVSIEESGKAYLFNEHVDKYHFSAPDVINIIIAITALVVSIVSIILTLRGKR